MPKSCILISRNSTNLSAYFDYLLIFPEIILQPDDWDDEKDGEWTAPTIPNPE